MGHVAWFHVSVVSGTGQVSSCKTEKHHCVVPELQCGQTYSVKMLAQGELCNSSYSPTRQVVAGLYSSVLVSL